MKFSISFIIPFHNESEYISETLESLESQILNDLNIEIILVDGDSTDNSVDVITAIIKNSKNPNIQYKILSNPDRKTPYGFNLGISNSKANIIGFGGAHTIYSQNLFKSVINTFNNIEANVVGGGFNVIKPDKPGYISLAISFLYDSPLGAGVASYHRKTEPGYVDTVFGGFYERSVFDKVGYFNVALSRCQDYELNVRVRKSGFKIYFDPALNNIQIFKTDLRLLYKRSFNTGFYFPEAWFSNISNLNIRHIVPLLFLIYLISLCIVFMFSNHYTFFLFPLITYLALMILSTFHLMVTKKNIISSLITFPLFFMYHLTYGLGTMFGIFYHMFRSKKS